MSVRGTRLLVRHAFVHDEEIYFALQQRFRVRCGSRGLESQIPMVVRIQLTLEREKTYTFMIFMTPALGSWRTGFLIGLFLLPTENLPKGQSDTTTPPLLPILGTHVVVRDRFMRTRGNLGGSARPDGKITAV